MLRSLILIIVASIALTPSMGFSQGGNGRITCPNRDCMPGPFPDHPPCPPPSGGGGGGAAGGGAGDGGGDRCAGEKGEADASGGGGAGVGDPIMIDKGFVVRREVDFSIPVKYGLKLEVGRVYSSVPNLQKGFGLSYDNSMDMGMFGQNWYCPYETRLEFSPNYEGQWPDNFVYIDESANWHHLDEIESEAKWRARLDQGMPFELTIGENNGPKYYLTGGDGSLRIFNPNGTIYEYYPDLTQAHARVRFEYATNGNLWKVLAPSGDDRFLEFEYYTVADTQYTNPTHKVKAIHFKTSINQYQFVSRYYYDANSYLSHAKGNRGQMAYWYQYEYGSFPIASTPTDMYPALNYVSGAGPILGRVSYWMDNERDIQMNPIWRPLVAYTYNEHFSNSASRSWTWDISQNPPQWKQTLSLNAHPWNHMPVVYYGDGVPDSPGMDDASTEFVTNYQCDITDITYDNTIDKMPETHLFSKSVQPHGGEAKPRMPQRMRRANPNSSDPNDPWQTIWEYTYNLTTPDEYDMFDPEYLALYRIEAFSQFYDTSSVITKSYTYASDLVSGGLWFKNATTTSPTGEQVSLEYYSVAPNQGKLKARTEGGRRTEYYYNPDHLVEKIKDVQYGTEVNLTYNSRGQVIQVSSPDGNVTSFTYNDFGQVLTETRAHLGTTTYKYSDQVSSNSSEYCIPPRLIEVKDASNNVTHLYYDGASRVTKMMDANAKSAEIFYNRRGLVAQRKNGEGQSNWFEYDVYDRLVKYTDERGKSTEYKYDMFGRVTEEKDPDGFVTKFYYTDGAIGAGGCGGCSGGGANLVSRVVRQDGSPVALEYDLAGRLTRVDYELIGSPGSDEVVFTYDNSSRVTSVFDNRLTTLAGNKTYSYTYETGATGTGRIKSITHPEGWVQEFIYQDSPLQPHYKQLIAYRDVDGNVTPFSYDAIGRLTSIGDPFGGATTFNFATPADTAFPIGAIKGMTRSNASKVAYTYDMLARIDRIEYQNPLGVVGDYIDLTYDPAGMITERERKDGASFYTTRYTYDNAYRLHREANYDSLDVMKTRRTYYYDAAGNRNSMNIWNSAGLDKWTNYAYGNRNQIVSNTGYYREGTSDTGPMAYTWDAKGNMTSQTGQNFGWNEDNRLVSSSVFTGDPKNPVATKYFKYDSEGRRILEYNDQDGVRKRHFFNGLTEETRKVSVAEHGDAAFVVSRPLSGVESSEWTSPGGGVVETTWNTQRYSTFYYFFQPTCGGGDFVSPAFNPSETKRVVSYWIKNEDLSCPAVVGIDVSTSAGVRRVELSLGAGTNTYSNGVYSVFLNKNTAAWQRIERDIHRIVSEMTPGVTVINAFGLRARGKVCAVDDVRFSNSMTVENNTLGLDVVGHILHNRQIDPSTYASTDRWFNYDQVGSVISEGNNLGDITQLHQQDAFGNTQSGWSAGLWGGDEAGWHHNSTAFDPEVSLSYMFQRWYSQEIGGFVSKTTVSPVRENSYTFAASNPTVNIDPEGLMYFRSGFSGGFGAIYAVTFGVGLAADSCGNVGIYGYSGRGVGGLFVGGSIEAAFGGFIPGTAPGFGNAQADMPQDFSGPGAWATATGGLLGKGSVNGGVTGTGAWEGGAGAGIGAGIGGAGGFSNGGFIPIGNTTPGVGGMGVAIPC